MQISQNNYSKPAFGMAFEKPNKEVMGYLKGVVSSLSQPNREAFVKNFTEIVDKAKTCPVSIGHTLVPGAYTQYMPTVAGRNISHIQANGHAGTIIERMTKAVKEAEDVHNINIAMGKIEKCFDLKA